MKILLVNDQFNDGGAARVACTMCNELMARGYEIHVATDNEASEIRYPLDHAISIHTIPMETKGRGKWARVKSMFKAAKAIRRHIKAVQPDVIIAIQANCYLRTLIANRGTRIPLIAADHTSFYRKMDWINTLTRHRLYKYADGLSILTERDARYLGDKYPQKRVIYNPNSYPILTEETQRDKTILCAGRFDIWKTKGFDWMIEIWSKLASKYPEWQLQMAGTGSEASVNYIKSLIEEAGITDRVTLLGQVDDMKTLYAHTGIFALPSRTEGMPMVLLEALSQGCPCVAFNVGGASSEMIDAGSGLVIDDADLIGFEKALELLMQDETRRTQYSKNAIKSVDKFSVEKFVDKWVAMINDTLKK